MKRRIFSSICLASFVALLLTAFLIIGLLYSNSERDLRASLASNSFFISRTLELYDDTDSYVASVGRQGNSRITIIAADGKVLYDNFAAPESMDNHLTRPEVQDAISHGVGESTRLSDTLGEKTYYYAVKLDNGNILRVSSTTRSVLGMVESSLIWVVLVYVLVLVIAAVLARLLTNSIISPLNKLDLDSPLSNTSYDELSPLLLRMEKQNSRINEQFTALTEKQKEFEYVTEAMSEGLVIFGESGVVLSSNRSARKLFDFDDGASYLKVCRDIDYIKAVEGGLEGRATITKISRFGRTYELSVSPVGAKSGKHAAVLFAVDITEKEASEKMRREFSANVSHELKTPLTSIMGCAEIIQNGIAKSEDVPRFANQIYSEASRLLRLIEDIIRLSMLDEKNIKREFSPVNLKALAETVKEELVLKADSKNISLGIKGENLFVSGIENTLHEMLYNLADNAINYNRDGGKVCIGVFEEGGKTVLSVSDTGVGIAPEHHERIFERFYRVDKSHSRETGGTGLGLSIVKHGARLHGAEIELKSSVGEGTVIRIIFPGRP